MKDGKSGRPKKTMKRKWLDNTLPDPHPCTAQQGGRARDKEEEHVIITARFDRKCHLMPKTRKWGLSYSHYCRDIYWVTPLTN